MAADWSQLLPELVMEIAKNLTVVTDQISFANVCNSWQSSVSTLENFFVSPPRFPYLLLAENKRKSVSVISKLFNDWKDEDEDEEGEEQPNNNNNNIRRRREVFFLTPKEDGKIYKILLPEAANKRCLSSHGWLLTVSVSEENFESVDAALVHPLTRRQIQLPKLDTFPRYEYHHVGYGHMISKMVLSSDPLLSDEDFFVMVIWGCPEQVGYCRPGFPSWIKLPREEYRLPVDINYHNGRMYIVDWWGDICSCDMRDDQTRILHGQPKPDLDGDMCSCSGIFQTHPKLPDEIEGIEIERATNRLFYVLGGFDDDDDDKLLVVVRVGRKDIRADYNYKENKTTGFQVFEINLKDDRWVKVESLGDRALFLGYNTSISLQADGSIVKPNCIYFTEDFYERYAGDESEGGGRDMGIYHLSDGTIEPHFKGESLDVVSPPLWVVPSF